MKGVARLGVPDLVMTDAGLDVGNPLGGRKGDTATALSLNSQEINKWFLDAQIDPDAHRESELLGFQIGIERGNPGALMGAYNKVNGEYACGNDTLLNKQIKDAIGFKGFVMSDGHAVWSWDFALKGLDQHSGVQLDDVQLDDKEWFVGPPREA